MTARVQAAMGKLLHGGAARGGGGGEHPQRSQSSDLPASHMHQKSRKKHTLTPTVLMYLRRHDSEALSY